MRSVTTNANQNADFSIKGRNLIRLGKDTFPLFPSFTHLFSQSTGFIVRPGLLYAGAELRTLSVEFACRVCEDSPVAGPRLLKRVKNALKSIQILKSNYHKRFMQDVFKEKQPIRGYSTSHEQQKSKRQKILLIKNQIRNCFIKDLYGQKLTV